MRHAQHRAPPYRPAAAPAPTPRAGPAVRRVGARRPARAAAVRGAAHARGGRPLRHPPAARAAADGHRVAEPRARGNPGRLGRARPARLRGGPPPGRADGAGRRPPGRDRRPAPAGRHHPGLRPERRRHRARRVPGRGRAARGARRDGVPVRVRRHHRLPGVPPDDPGRPDRAGDVGQAPIRHRDGEQPDLRPAGRRDLADPGPHPRGHAPALARHPGPRRHRPAADGRDPDRRRRLRAVPAQAATHGRSAGLPRGFDTERFLRRLAPTLARDESVVAGLHVFTFNQVAATEAWRAGLLAQLREGGADPRSSPTGPATES